MDTLLPLYYRVNEKFQWAFDVENEYLQQKINPKLWLSVVDDKFISQCGLVGHQPNTKKKKKKINSSVYSYCSLD